MYGSLTGTRARNCPVILVEQKVADEVILPRLEFTSAESYSDRKSTL